VLLCGRGGRSDRSMIRRKEGIKGVEERDQVVT
jgi:hypothetical protein